MSTMHTGDCDGHLQGYSHEASRMYRRRLHIREIFRCWAGELPSLNTDHHHVGTRRCAALTRADRIGYDTRRVAWFVEPGGGSIIGRHINVMVQALPTSETAAVGKKR